MQYLQRYRVNQAKPLLKNSQKSITEIALAVGFTDSGYFSRVFNRQTGMSPEAFRRLKPHTSWWSHGIQRLLSLRTRSAAYCFD